MPFTISKKLQDNILTNYPDTGAQWLASLPDLINKLAAQWNLSDIKFLEEVASFNFVATAIQREKYRERKVVLKIISTPEQRETQVLATYNGNGCIQPIAVDHNARAILLPFLEGHDLMQNGKIDETEFCQHVTKILETLHTTKCNEDFPILHDYLKKKLTEIIPNSEILPALDSDALQKAHAYIETIIPKDPEHWILLHGDFHPYNIIGLEKESKTFIAIDPVGFIGDPAYDVACISGKVTPIVLAKPDPYNIVKDRIRYFSEHLNLDPVRISQWGYVHFILAAWWLRGEVNDQQIPRLSQQCLEMAGIYAKLEKDFTQEVNFGKRFDSGF
jgi:streptomycin 6-kinase